MQYTMSAEYFAQQIQCTREGRRETLPTVHQLVELAFAARSEGLLKMDDMVNDYARFPDPFLRKAVNLVVEVANEESIRQVLYNFILSSKRVANNNQFLNQVVIAEAMLAISRSEDLDYVFTYLIPSFFGVEYEREVVNVYRNYKKQLINGR